MDVLEFLAEGVFDVVECSYQGLNACVLVIWFEGPRRKVFGDGWLKASVGRLGGCYWESEPFL